MLRRRISSVLTLCLCLVAAVLFLGYDRVANISWSDISDVLHHNGGAAATPVAEKQWSQYETALAYVDAMMNTSDASLPRLACPAPSPARYGYLQGPPAPAKPPAPGDMRRVKYFFALDLRRCLPILPTLLGAVIAAARFLGPTSCLLSIVMGSAVDDDGTLEALDRLQPALEAAGLRCVLRLSKLDPDAAGEAGWRVWKRAALRNMALAPLVTPEAFAAAQPKLAVEADADTTVVFVDAVLPCASDILELVHQRRAQGAHMTCAMDWEYASTAGGDGQPRPTFRDAWEARTLRGDLFFRVDPGRPSLDHATRLFWNDNATLARFASHRPFQVYACWNGMAAFGAGSVLGLPPPPEWQREGEGEGNVKKDGGAGGHDEDEDEDSSDAYKETKLLLRNKNDKIAFRTTREGECYGGEPGYFCKDSWWAGYGRIAVVPSVNLAYSLDAAVKIKAAKGYVEQWTDPATNTEDAGLIAWVDEPPRQVLCAPDWSYQSWKPWNETLP